MYKIGNRVNFLKDGSVSDTGTVDSVCGDFVWVCWDSDGQKKFFISDDKRFQLMSVKEHVNQMIDELTDACIQILQTSQNVRKFGIDQNAYALQLQRDIKRFKQVTLRINASGMLNNKPKKNS